MGKEKKKKTKALSRKDVAKYKIVKDPEYELQKKINKAINFYNNNRDIFKDIKGTGLSKKIKKRNIDNIKRVPKNYQKGVNDVALSTYVKLTVDFIDDLAYYKNNGGGDKKDEITKDDIVKVNIFRKRGNDKDCFRQKIGIYLDKASEDKKCRNAYNIIKQIKQFAN
jgi:hypothetical protein